jgi:hypothetical protein
MKKSGNLGLICRITLLIVMSLTVKGLSAETDPSDTAGTLPQRSPTYEAYIRKYHKLAIMQQQRYRVPASITLAQGLLESSAGQSYLAVAANNHFGIKCTDWRGMGVYKEDHGSYECFRKYLSEETCYDDHSRFLTERPHYKPLFELALTDYKSWAHGLKECGYAVDSLYASKLIRLIETYELFRYDTFEPDGAALKAASPPKLSTSSASKPSTFTEAKPRVRQPRALASRSPVESESIIEPKSESSGVESEYDSDVGDRPLMARVESANEDVLTGIFASVNIPPSLRGVMNRALIPFRSSSDADMESKLAEDPMKRVKPAPRRRAVRKF